MASNKTTFGASIVRLSQPTNRETILPPTINASPALTPAVSQESLAATYAEHRPIPPHSPFYQHPPASHERVTASSRLAPNSKTHLDVGTVEKGMDSADVTPISATDDNPFTSKVSVDANKECTMWPSRQTLVKNQIADKKQRRDTRWFAFAGLRHTWAEMPRKQRLIVQLLLALIVVGAMVGLGVGISKAVHGSYYSGSNSSTTT